MHMSIFDRIDVSAVKRTCISQDKTNFCRTHPRGSNNSKNGDLTKVGQRDRTPLLLHTASTIIAPQKSRRTANHLHMFKTKIDSPLEYGYLPLISHNQEQSAILKIEVIFILSQKSLSLAIASYGREALGHERQVVAFRCKRSTNTCQGF